MNERKEYTVYFSGKITICEHNRNEAVAYVYELLRENGFYDYQIDGVEEDG